jgi:serine/threonine-protein kinase HipA
VERFDRRVTPDQRLLRLPQEDCCQALSVPWTKKYESEGGPGIPRILKLLAGSNEPANDQRMFLKANLVFWLLAATDGHAKNFSIALYPGGRYQMTPLYDVVSAEPSSAAGHIRHNQLKLAMAVGKSRHYVVGRIAPRHFVESAALGGMGRRAAVEVIDEVYETGPRALDQTLAKLPRGFPPGLADAVANGVHQRLGQLPGIHDPRWIPD